MKSINKRCKDITEQLIEKMNYLKHLNTELNNLKDSGLDFSDKYNFETLMILLYPTRLTKKVIREFIKEYNKGSKLFKVEIRRKVRNENKVKYVSASIEITYN